MSLVFSTPVSVFAEVSDHHAELREEEEARLLIRAERVPLKARWRRSWKPDQIIDLASRYAVELKPVSGEVPTDERRAVNFLRHERTAYDKLTAAPGGLQHGMHGSYESVYLVIKRRVHEKIAADFPWLEVESMIQLDEAVEAASDKLCLTIVRK